MQTKFNNSMLAHVWAQQSQSEGNGSNMFFRDSTIYSYGHHFPMASFAKPDLVLFNSGSYSVTTSKHQSYVHRAIHHSNYIKVPYCVIGRSNRDKKIHHDGNLRYLRDSMDGSLVKSSRARTYKDLHLRNAEQFRRDYNRYLEVFKIRRKPIAELPSIEQLRAEADKARKCGLAREKKRQKQLIIDNQDKIDRWLNGEAVSIFHTGIMLLRVIGNNVETSHNAKFPVDHARKAYKVIKAVKSSGKTWKRNGQSIRLGHFQIDSIDTSGNVKAGCHNVTWSEIHRIGETI